jgi:peptidoglycan/xylan/chitin deacetylase (PgdA/CDA1 family)/Flp pilus assembly protein TadD
MRKKTVVILAAAVAALACLLFFVRPSQFLQPAFRPDPALQSAFDGVRDDYRKIIVLMDGADQLDDATHARAVAAGRLLFFRKQHALEEIGAKLNGGRNANGARQLIHYLSADAALHDADKLAFADLVEELVGAVPAASPSPGARSNPLDDQLKNLWDNIESIELAYRQEVTKIFSQFATRGAAGSREKWDAYTAWLRTLTHRDKILAEFGDVVTPEPEQNMRGASNEIFGTDFPDRSVALTFDDGPHPKYTEQILALLRKYGIRACFFELGEHLGTVDAQGAVKLIPTAEVSRKVLAAGHMIANHSYSHPVLPKLDEEQRRSEIDRTNLLLSAVMGHPTDLFRAPYGARNKEILDQVNGEGMKSVMWSIDSEDWADPIPESIAMRVLHQLMQKQKGIILFHDIHKQGVLALSPVVEELLRQNYTFLSPEKGKFVKEALPPEPQRAGDASGSDATAEFASTGQSTGTEARHSYYRKSWAVIIGINDYAHWPKLRYAVNDANGIEEALITKFGFKKENVRKLVDGDATRQRIMQVLGDELTDGNKVQREDRVFFFFAGHGATRTFEDGRQVGFIVPVDADQQNYVSTAISMTQIREASDLIPAKHVYFVMDSCYSGLALSRGSGAFAKDKSYLDEVTRREARQILTAGGADQQVADDGPNGHSVFTWAVLQGLDGAADLDGNGVITASELGAYISPIVSEFARQTPVVGNMVGSEGGEFVFELQPEALTSRSPQMDSQAMHLNQQLSTLQKEIASKQAELLKLQQSVQAEADKLAQVTRSGAPAPAAAPPKAKTKANQAYDLDRQGLQLYREKKYDEALGEFQGAVALKPGDPVLLNNLSFIYYVMGRYDDAVANLQKTLEIDPQRKEAHENLGDAYLKLGKRAEAKAQYEQFLALNPASSRADELKRVLKTLQ